MRMRAAGSDDTSSVYNTMMAGSTSTGAAATLSGTDISSWTAGDINSTFPINALTMDVIAPKLARFTDLTGQIVASTSGNFTSYSGGMTFRGTTAFDSLSFIVGGGSNITGDYRVYGYTNS
jgi:hypothetical protein